MANLMRFGVRTTASACDRLLLRSAPAVARSCCVALATRNLSSTVQLLQNEAVKKTARAIPQGYQSDSDSDSDDDLIHEHHEKGTTDFWRRKIRTFHSLIDLNDDGVVSIEDFKILAERFISMGHLTPNQEDDFRAALKVVWEEQWGLAHPYNLVTAEQYLENMHHVLNDKSLKRKAHHFLPHLFQAVDKDGDGFISQEEFELFFECLGLGGQEAAESFKAIDENDDGKLSVKEFVKLGREYFISEDESKPSKLFWGPLTKP